MPSRTAEYFARVSHACRIAYERNELAEIEGLSLPVDPLEYLNDRETAFLQAVEYAVAVDRLDLAAKIVRNLGPLYESRSHLVTTNTEWWDDILGVVNEASAFKPDDIARGIVLVLLARRERVQNKWSEAQAMAVAATAWCVAHSDRDPQALALEADAREILGETHRSFGTSEDLAEAVRQFKEGLVCVSRLADDDARRSLELRLRDRLGYAYFLLGEHARAMHELNRSVELHYEPTTNPSELSRTLNNLGKVYLVCKRRDDARRCFERSLALKRTMGDKRGEAICHHEIGILYRANCDFDKAIAKLNESLAIKHRIDDRHGAGLSLMELGVTYESCGNRNRAVECFESALLYLTRGSAQEARVREHMEELGTGLNDGRA